MGLYVDTSDFSEEDCFLDILNKCEDGGEVVNKDQMILCQLAGVVAVMYSQRELQVFKDDPREKKWFIMDKKIVRGYCSPTDWEDYIGSYDKNVPCFVGTILDKK